MRRRRDQKTTDETTTIDHRNVNRYRSTLIGGTLVFLGLAYASTHWLPDESYLEWIFIFFAAHSAATLLLQEVRGYNDVELS